MKKLLIAVIVIAAVIAHLVVSDMADARITILYDGVTIGLIAGVAWWCANNEIAKAERRADIKKAFDQLMEISDTDGPNDEHQT